MEFADIETMVNFVKGFGAFSINYGYKTYMLEISTERTTGVKQPEVEANFRKFLTASGFKLEADRAGVYETYDLTGDSLPNPVGEIKVTMCGNQYDRLMNFAPLKDVGGDEFFQYPRSVTIAVFEK